MTEFIANMTTFPVIVMTGLLLVVLFYWVFAIIGVLGIDILDADAEIEFEVETDLDLDVDASSQGAGGLAGFMLRWGLTGVPITVIISVLITVSWLLCYLLAVLVMPVITTLLPFELVRWLLGIMVLVLSVMIAVPITATLIKPFKGMFKAHDAVTKADLIGRMVVVKTSSVNLDFGQGELDDGEAGMLLDIRAEETEQLSKGDEALLVDYRPEDGSYLVVKKQ